VFFLFSVNLGLGTIMKKPYGLHT